ncbi:MAG TPA: hypothetical protein VJ742_13130 [Nitrososphaera sp.]|nr:hypothetical protein [Nitrososphaera sp.]
MDEANIEVQVTDLWLTILKDGQKILELAIEEDGTVGLALPVFDDVNFANHTPHAGRRLRVSVAHRERNGDEVAVPRWRRTEIAPEVEVTVTPPRRPEHKRGTRLYESTVPRIGSVSRDQVLNAILDSEIDAPRQNNERRETETRRIAEKFELRLMQVAGVRAALTRHMYGDPMELMRNRMVERFGKEETERRMPQFKQHPYAHYVVTS